MLLDFSVVADRIIFCEMAKLLLCSNRKSSHIGQGETALATLASRHRHTAPAVAAAALQNENMNCSSSNDM